VSQVAYRAAAVKFLSDYATFAGIGLQVYPGRPRTLRPPTAFVDGINETFTPYAGLLVQRVPIVRVIVIHGLFDSKDAVTQKDEFVDGLVDWVVTNVHGAGTNTLIRVSETQDLPDYVPEWLPPEQQHTYYATEISLEGFAT
jgi:hypothetical protein